MRFISQKGNITSETWQVCLLFTYLCLQHCVSFLGWSMLQKLSNNLVDRQQLEKIVCFKIGIFLFLRYDNFELVNLIKNDCKAFSSSK